MTVALISAGVFLIGIITLGGVCWWLGKPAGGDVNFEDAPDSFPESPEDIVRRVYEQ